MSRSAAILLTLLASTLARIGVVLLKQAALECKEKPRFLLAMALSARAIGGLALQVAGLLLFLFALHSPHAPISILQPMRAFGLVVMAFLAVIYLHERLGLGEWLGVVLSLVGIGLLTFSRNNETSSAGNIDQALLMALDIACAFVAAGCASVILLRRPTSALDAVHGVLAGMFLGIGYLHIKVAFLALQHHRVSLLITSVVLMAVGLIGGVVILIRSFRHARALVVTTVNMLVNELVTIVGGCLCLGEKLPGEPLSLAATLMGFAAVLAGIALFGTVR